uniref:Uncharacterized protein n=1 Tax=Rheinheimera sp. BAL341 TaxID=1708203 RepID=A0A486XQV3_9GAMM
MVLSVAILMLLSVAKQQTKVGIVAVNDYKLAAAALLSRRRFV